MSAPPPPALTALLVLALTCARADGCMYSGRWFAEGAAVTAHDACLRCRCAHGALSCARAACAPAPDPPPRRCALMHRRGACCPELHCPEGVKSLELIGDAQLEEELQEVSTPAAPGHACVEEGAVFAAGSALAARAACEQCFCLRGVRRCVRPRCLPPPPGCSPRPAPAACCPQRYYCTAPTPSSTTSISSDKASHRHDCKMNGQWVSEGERVVSSTVASGNCTQCFCLRGAVQCQPLACAPALRGCTPLLRPGHCCPHQYQCSHHHSGSENFVIPMISDNALIPTRNDERAFRPLPGAKLSSVVSTTKSLALETLGTRSRSAAPPTTKVKRKTDDEPTQAATRHQPRTTMTSTTPTAPTTSEDVTSETEQPEGSVKIIINGTINCTAELSSGLTNVTVSNYTNINGSEVEARVPHREVAAETTDRVEGVEDTESAQTASPVDIITQRSDFDDRDSFIVNVSSSLMTNTSRSSASPPPSLSPAAPTAPTATADLTPMPNVSNTAKEDYDYDYPEPTLPPSLPNLKIIPFVAADAVVEDAPVKKESVSYPALAREDKFPVYYPSAAPAQVFADRRQDVYGPAQYPELVEEDVTDHNPVPFPEITKPAAKPPSTSTTREARPQTPAVNLFSPPVETEGGFIPKGPGIIDEYYAVYPSSPPPVPHLTTSMPINPNTPDADCLTKEGVRVLEGDSARVGCGVCTCEWGELRCAALRCPAPSGCTRRAAASDRCCGDLVCGNENSSTPKATTTPRRPDVSPTTITTPLELDGGLVPFDPPPDRSVPPPVKTNEVSSTAKADSMLSEVTTATPAASTTPTTKSTTLLSKTASNATARPLSTLSPSSMAASTTATPLTTITQPLDRKDNNETKQHSEEYEEEEEEDDGFSFGSVLKLLLSDGYDSTTQATTKKKASTTMKAPITSPTVPPTLPPTTRSSSPRPTVLSTGLPTYPYAPPKKVFIPNTVNRIDHLVLGEATAIRKSTPRPVTTPFRPLPPKRFTMRPSSHRPPPPTRLTLPPPASTEPTLSAPLAPSKIGAGGAGLFKLAGCNIYGRMYRVGRIITELSTPCQECRCTELGVQCAPLQC